MTKEKIIKKYSVVDPSGMTLLTPFVISKKRKLLYFHIAKTGGSTIYRILKDNGLDDGVLSNKKLDHKSKVDYFEEIAEDWDDYFKFTFVRNKYDLLYSLWNYDGRPGGTFENFIMTTVRNSQYQYGMWIDQYYLTVDDCSLFDFVGHQENFSNDLKEAADRIGGLSYDESLHLNSAKYDHKVHFSQHYNNDMKEVVYDKFTKEIDYFGFTLYENSVS